MKSRVSENNTGFSIRLPITGVTQSLMGKLKDQEHKVEYKCPLTLRDSLISEDGDPSPELTCAGTKKGLCQGAASLKKIRFLGWQDYHMPRIYHSNGTGRGCQTSSV